MMMKIIITKEKKMLHESTIMKMMINFFSVQLFRFIYILNKGCKLINFMSPLIDDDDMVCCHESVDSFILYGRCFKCFK